MDVVAKALWFIESNGHRAIDLDDIAASAGVSRFHLSRVFGQSLGRSVISHLRVRRLAKAAASLAAGAPDILGVAFDAGYSSHEAFTRAFRDCFGQTQEKWRKGPDLEKLKAMEAIIMHSEQSITVPMPTISDIEGMTFVGLGERYAYDAMDAIPAQWQRFNAMSEAIADVVPGGNFGICANADAEGIDYICAAQVKEFSDVPSGLSCVKLPAQRYAIFSHPGHITEIRPFIRAIMGDWLPASGLKMAEAASLEHYGASFDPRTGAGGFEIWIPLQV